MSAFTEQLHWSVAGAISEQEAVGATATWMGVLSFGRLRSQRLGSPGIGGSFG
jgi:hypothetical protein